MTPSRVVTTAPISHPSRRKLRHIRSPTLEDSCRRPQRSPQGYLHTPTPFGPLCKNLGTLTLAHPSRTSYLSEAAHS